MERIVLIGASISTTDLIDRLTSTLTHEELLEFIKKLDLEVADWDFTNELIKHFDEQHKIYEDEVVGS